MVHFVEILLPVAVLSVLCGLVSILVVCWTQYQARKLQEETEENKMMEEEEEQEDTRVFFLRPVSNKYVTLIFIFIPPRQDKPGLR